MKSKSKTWKTYKLNWSTEEQPEPYTIRDLYACSVIKGILSSYPVDTSLQDLVRQKTVLSETAFEIADALMKVRKVKS